MEIIHCDQISSEWFQLHVGRVTGSKAETILNFNKSGKESSARETLRWTKAAEILTQIAVQQNYVSFEMKEGLINEPAARSDYSLEEGVLVEKVGFVIAHDRLGCSPDGLVNDDGIVGFKCPKASTHLRWMLDGVIPEEHVPQARLELACMPERKWFDFRSFVPDLPKRYRGFTIRLMREDAQIPEMIAAVDQFNTEVDAMIARLEDIAPPVEEDDPRPAEDFGELGITDDLIRMIEPNWKGAAQ